MESIFVGILLSAVFITVGTLILCAPARAISILLAVRFAGRVSPSARARYEVPWGRHVTVIGMAGPLYVLGIAAAVGALLALIRVLASD